jgi:hypothetical protein
MKKILISLLLILVGTIVFGQLPTIVIPSAISAVGDSPRTIAIKTNSAIVLLNDLRLYDFNAEELAVLDGVLATATEMNMLVGIDTLLSVQAQLDGKQDSLESGVTIKTINGLPILGSGDMTIVGGGGSMLYPAAGIALSTGAAWNTSITNNSVNWDSSYVARLRWDGGTTSLVAATGRTSLGGTTIGQSMFTLVNPSAVTFPRFNADNTITALSAANLKTALSLTATDVSLGNVTNESKATMFTSPAFTGTPTVATAITADTNDGAALGTTSVMWSDLFLASGGVVNFNNGDITLTHSSNVLTLGGGDLALGANNLSMTGSIGVTGTRVTKGWFTDLEVTNAIAGSITGNAATVTGYTRNSGSLTLSGGHGITATTTGTTAITLPVSGTLATTANVALKVNISDTTSMLTPYIARGDTASMLTRYIARSDTASMLTPYIREAEVDAAFADTVSFETEELGDVAPLLTDYENGIVSIESTGTVVAGTGITTVMLSRFMYFNTAAAIDISVDPQIANGTTGQIITIIGSSDTNTLTLDDSAGLRLTGQMVIGIGDNITLLYEGTIGDWVEICRSNN